MRKFVRETVLAGMAIIALTGAALGLANDKRTMTVDPPDGSLARIEYKGNIPPKVAIQPASQFMPIGFADHTMFAPFSMFDRIAADLDRQSDVMLRQAQLIEVPRRRVGHSMPAGCLQE